MLPKVYQEQALNLLDEWSGELRTQREKSANIAAALNNQGIVVDDIPPELRDCPRMAWEALGARGRLPMMRDSRGNEFIPPHAFRKDALGNSIPHACVKIPTGGGKTFMGASALTRLGVSSGLVLWIVPSRAIYAQTWDAFKNRAHPYREQLDRAGCGRVKLLTKESPFSQADLEGGLCMMPLMLQAAARKNERNFLRMFRNSGRYPSFFPPMEILQDNLDFLKEHPDLESFALVDGGPPGAVKQSLLNVFKLVRPVIVLDEAHNAYSDDRREQLGKFNPRMILELSATPDWRKSNILVNISGEALRREHMIKLPLNVSSPRNIDWKQALAFAKKKRDELEAEAEKLRAQTGRYIRPIMLVRVEHVGKALVGQGGIHAEDVRAHLRDHLNVPPEHIRRKTAENDEIGREDLLSEFCPVRYILTKNALQEGWDCAFAYVLAMLDSTTAARALTQMAGRILRQPGAELTGVDALDECYVFCCNRDVDAAVNKVKLGLEGEGLTDLTGFVRGSKSAEKVGGNSLVAKRRGKFSKYRVVLPRVLHKRGRKFVPLNYDADILWEVPWEEIMRRPLGLALGEVEAIDDSIVRVGLRKNETVGVSGEAAAVEKVVTLEFFARYLGDVIPNPFVSAEIARMALDSLREAAGGNDGLYDRRYQIAEAMKRRLRAAVEKESRDVFCRKLRDGEIRFELKAGDEYELPMEETKPGDDSQVFAYGGRIASKSLLEPMLSGEFNGLERDFAIHLEGVQAVEWWHRFAARRGYALQGWRRHRVYPDFIACIGEGRGPNRRVLVLETKGMHLSGNPDTEYKRELLEKLSAKNPHALECGNVTLKTGGREVRMVLRLLLEEGWREEFDKLAGGE